MQLDFVERVQSMNIFWESTESHLIVNPSYPRKDQDRFHRILDLSTAWPGHIWLSTSGSSVQKWVGLSKQAILSSAQAVNQHLQSTREDRWVNCLPSFHVGGLGIWGRAYLTKAKVFDYRELSHGKWDAEQFYKYIEQVQGTLTALVPTQLHDLVLLKKRAPSSIRALVIGGGRVLPDLYERAIALGWPILPSYGLTECGSQVATAPLQSWLQNQLPILQLLSHIQACERSEQLCFAGTSLLSTYAYLDNEKIQFIDPKENGWLMTEDRGKVDQDKLTVIGRVDDVIKVGGENVDLSRLDNQLQDLRLKMAIVPEAVLVALPDDRLGQIIVCVSDSLTQLILDPLIQKYQQTVLPFERIKKVVLVSRIPRSPLGKLLKKDVCNLILK